MTALEFGAPAAHASSGSSRWRLGAACLLLWAAVGPAQPARAPAASQTLRGLTLRVYEGSQLVAGGDERLTLVPGQALAPERPAAAAVSLQLERALAGLPELPFEHPLDVHLDPRLPPGQAALGGLEVHVSSRSLLVTRGALEAAATGVWRHELLHALAAAPPAHAQSGARHLWLALEEGLVQYLAGSLGVPPSARHASLTASAREVPYWAEALASPGYDPHPLAAQLARSLRDIDPQPELHDWLPCLAAAPEQAAVTLGALPLRFAERCPAGAARQLRQALGARATTLPVDAVADTRHAAPGKAAAHAPESR